MEIKTNYVNERMIPHMVACNPVNYGRGFCSRIDDYRIEEQADFILSKFKWGINFFTVNEEVFQYYRGCFIAKEFEVVLTNIYLIVNQIENLQIKSENMNYLLLKIEMKILKQTNQMKNQSKLSKKSMKISKKVMFKVSKLQTMKQKIQKIMKITQKKKNIKKLNLKGQIFEYSRKIIN